MSKAPTGADLVANGKWEELWERIQSEPSRYTTVYDVRPFEDRDPYSFLD